MGASIQPLRRAVIDLDDFRITALMGAGVGLGIAMFNHGNGVPCPLRTLTGVPCPLCGLTTSVEASIHGHIGTAIAANPGGPLIIAAGVAVWTIARRKQTASVNLWVVWSALAVMWLWELHRFHWT